MFDLVDGLIIQNLKDINFIESEISLHAKEIGMIF